MYIYIYTVYSQINVCHIYIWLGNSIRIWLPPGFGITDHPI